MRKLFSLLWPPHRPLPAILPKLGDHVAEAAFVVTLTSSLALLGLAMAGLFMTVALMDMFNDLVTVGVKKIEPAYRKKKSEFERRFDL